MEYKLEFSVDNENYLEIHTNKRISRGIVNFDYLDSIKYVEANKKQKELAKKLFEVEGVCSIFIEQYSVGIEKSPLFNWGKMTPLLIKRINKSVSPLEKAVKIPG